ncbi:hypothetical protein ACH5RR_003768 [Cinchona calisaya]|uniref:Uncharacterized protein n=1 Tax=Cinchona calisaya TaxID=153742 RepID=A0ABD3AVQ8_9GENT
MSKRHPYPPCEDFGCEEHEVKCCTPGYPYSWPNLVGMEGNQAKAIIEKDNPVVTVKVIQYGFIHLEGWCCNRVLVWLNDDGKVEVAPIVG